MARIIDSRKGLDLTVRIFDEFYAFDLVINGNEYDVVRSFFEGMIPEKQIAGNFTVYFFRISQETGIPALQLLDYIKGKNKMEVTTVIAYYLNSFKSKTSLYGLGTPTKPNESIQRNIVQ